MKKVIAVCVILAVAVSSFGASTDVLTDQIADAESGNFTGKALLLIGSAVAGVGFLLIPDSTYSPEAIASIGISIVGSGVALLGALLWFESVITGALLKHRLFEGHSENEPEEEDE